MLPVPTHQGPACLRKLGLVAAQCWGASLASSPSTARKAQVESAKLGLAVSQEIQCGPPLALCTPGFGLQRFVDIQPCLQRYWPAVFVGFFWL